jgi:hypothetical protein
LVEREHTYEVFKEKLTDVYAYLEAQGRAAPRAASGSAPAE